jgi:hypothetical protein
VELAAGLEQTLMLTPGAYRLQAAFRGELSGPRGLVWRIACIGGGPPLGQSPMILGAAPAWKEAEMTFTVPEKDCKAQQLRPPSSWSRARCGSTTCGSRARSSETHRFVGLLAETESADPPCAAVRRCTYSYCASMQSPCILTRRFARLRAHYLPFVAGTMAGLGIAGLSDGFDMGHGEGAQEAGHLL